MGCPAGLLVRLGTPACNWTGGPCGLVGHGVYTVRMGGRLGKLPPSRPVNRRHCPSRVKRRGPLGPLRDAPFPDGAPPPSCSSAAALCALAPRPPPPSPLRRTPTLQRRRCLRRRAPPSPRLAPRPGPRFGSAPPPCAPAMAAAVLVTFLSSILDLSLLCHEWQ